MSEKLSPKQERFCEEYLTDLNATQAAIRAGYSQKTAGSQGGDLTQKPEIQAYIKELRQKQSLRTAITADRVLLELGKIAFSDMDDFAIVENGKLSLIATSARKPGRSSVIKKITQSESEGKEGGSFSQGLELHDKLKALELIGKHLKLFTEKHELSGPDGKPIEHKVADLPDEQLDARIAAMLGKVESRT